MGGEEVCEAAKERVEGPREPLGLAHGGGPVEVVRPNALPEVVGPQEAPEVRVPPKRPKRALFLFALWRAGALLLRVLWKIHLPFDHELTV